MRNERPRLLTRGSRLGRAMILAATAGLVLNACGGDSDADDAAPGEAGQTEEAGMSDEPVTLRFTWWGGDERHARTQQVIDLFEEEHPNITVQGEFKDWNGYWDSLATTVAANDAPDIIQMDELYIASYAESGVLLDLDTVADQLDTSNFDENAVATGAVDGAQYAIPVGLTAYSMVANLDLLDEYGVEAPDDNTWSWDDLKEIGTQISEASGGEVTGVQSWGFDIGGVNIWARQAGAALYDDEGNVALPPSVLVDYWNYLIELADSGAAPDPTVSVERATQGLDQSGTATNTSVFATWWNTQLTSLAAASGSRLALVQLPGESQDGPAVYYKPSMYWSIASTTEHPAEAALFVDFLANSDEAADVLKTDRGVPANEQVRAFLADQLAETDQAAIAYLDEVNVGETPRVTPNGASDVEAILQRYTEQVLFGQMTPEDAAQSFIDELQAEIDAA